MTINIKIYLVDPFINSNENEEEENYNTNYSIQENKKNIINLFTRKKIKKKRQKIKWHKKIIQQN